MDKPEDDEHGTTTLYCSSCGKSQHEVGKRVAGSGTLVCNECLDLSVGTSSEKEEQDRRLASRNAA